MLSTSCARMKHPGSTARLSMLTAESIAGKSLTFPNECRMYQHILDKLPYKSSFRFVDTILSLDEKGVTGEYTLRPTAFFYEDHFVGNPVTPGVMVTEVMPQIGEVVRRSYYMLNSPQFKSREPE